MPRPAPLSNQLREHLRNSGKTMYVVAQETGIAESTLSRFLNRKRSLSQSISDALGRYLCLDISQSHWTPTSEERMQEALAAAAKNMTNKPISKSRRKNKKTPKG